MITDDSQLEQAVEQIGRMCRSLASLRAEVLPRSREQFAMMAEGPLEEIRRLELEVSAYVDRALEPAASHIP